jgi:predicted nucleic acid-binding protein
VETLTGKFGWPAGRAEQACHELWHGAYWVLEPQEVEGSRDPDDNPILGCALESHARVIITGDQDLLVLHPHQGMDILEPAEFLARSAWTEEA